MSTTSFAPFQLSLTSDPAREEAPQDDGKDERHDRVGQDELRSNGPSEEARVARVPDPRVDARGDQLVVVSLLVGHLVREVGRGVDHGRGAQVLAKDDEAEAEVGEGGGSGEERRYRRGVGRPLGTIQEEMLEEKL